MNIVVDTSVILSGIISSKGGSRKLLLLFSECKINFIFSIETFLELAKAIKYPKILERVRYEDLENVLKNIAKKAKFVEPKEHFNLCRDKEDNKFLDVAYEAKAKYLITLDKDLLDLRDKNKEVKLKEYYIKVLKPEEFLESGAGKLIINQ